jgi:type II secretory pathway pseudopilin PulG
MRRSPNGLSGFTVLEVLTVCVLIAILVGIGYPSFISILEKARKTQATNEEQQIVTAVNAFYTEYGKYPLTPSNANDAYFGAGTLPAGSTNYGNNDVLIDVLSNNTGSPNNSATVTTLNPRGIVFLQPPSVKDNNSPKSGVIPNGATVSAPLRVGAWYDPWGSPYNVMIDVNYNNQLTNPYTDAVPPGGATLYLGVIVYSFGKNGALGGGPAAPGFSAAEPGTAGNFSASGDVISWQ